MRLFGYYAFHSVVNQIRKLFKTWVLIFILACAIMGGIIGYAAASFGDGADDYDIEVEYEDEDDESVEVEWSDDDQSEENQSEDEEVDENLIYESNSFTIKDAEDGFELIYSDGTSMIVTNVQVLEFLTLLIILGILVYNILSADKNGSKIFLPADVNILFAAPMKPQSVLLFRLMCQVGVSIFASVYLLFQIPNLMINLGLTLPTILGMIFAWLMLLVTSRLVQIFFYTLCSTKAYLKKYITPGVWGCLILMLGSFALYSTTKGSHYIPAAVRFFCAPWTRWIPFVGWLKGIIAFLVEGEYLLAFLCVALLLVGIGVLTWGIWRMKADFYEDAMAKSEETAALIASAQERGSLIAVKKKSRSGKIRRNQFERGHGADVFFFKSMYNRFRFAPMGVLTKTAITYLGVAVVSFLIGKLVESESPFTIVAFGIGAFVFFRAMGNPLEEDTRMPLFSMIPENTWLKLWWSVLAGSVNCLLDLLPAMILGAVLTKADPLIVPGYAALILSVDAYATIVGTFISLSIPESIGKLPKQLIQIFFIYFGLAPDVISIALGYYYQHQTIGMLVAAGVNLLFGAIFFLLTPLFLEPKAGARPWVLPLSEEERKGAGKMFGKMGLSAFLLLLVASALQILLAGIAANIWQDYASSPVKVYLLTFLPIDLIAFPMGFFLLRKMETEKPQRQSLSALAVIRYVIYSIMGMYLGNLVGTLVNAFIGLFTAEQAANPIAELAIVGDNVPIKILFLVIAAPVLEELFFRKFLIDRMRPYGEKTAMITTALMFGLFHGNFSQFFYATALGLVFAYIYLQTGKIRYTIGLHMGINFMGSIFAPYLLEKILGGQEDLTISALEELSKGPWTYIFLAYVAAMIVLTVVGILMLCIRIEKIRFRDVRSELAKGQIFKTVWLNPGMVLFFLGCAALFVVHL